MRMTVRRPWAWPWELRKHGILGINKRNADLLPYVNPSCYRKLADDKVETKALCMAHNIPVPHTYAVIECYGRVKHVEDIVGQRADFVVKPVRGASGRGVLVVVRRANGFFHLIDGRSLAPGQLRYHICAVLSGLYSLSGEPDKGIIEQRIMTHQVFEKLAVAGTPDIRLIVYQGAVVMAMLRLPTRRSRGRANLHQGAVGTGIDIETGQTFGGVFLNRMVVNHPDTGQMLSGVKIPYWNSILQIAVKLAALIRMGYMGVDIVLDANHGPIVLEVNARPGLSVQVANRGGLIPRLHIPSGRLAAAPMAAN